MRIAFVSQPGSTADLPVQRGAIQIWTHQVARRLAKRHEVTVVLANAGGQPEVEVSEGVIYQRLAPTWADRASLAGRLVDRHRLTRRGRPFFASRWWYPGYTRRMMTALRGFSPDVVHVMNFPHLAAQAKKAVPEAEIVLHMHAEWLSELDERVVRPAANAISAAVACSPYITEAILMRFPKLHAETLPNGVDVKQFTVSYGEAERNDVLFVGRLSPEKGLHVLIPAFASIAETHPTARLVLVGAESKAAPDFLDPARSDAAVTALRPYYKGAYVQRLRELVPSSLRERVQFVGPLPHAEVGRRIHQATIVVMPSIRETFGMPALEAIASGVPVVASDVGGLSALVQGRKTGRLVPRNDQGALAAALDEILAGPDWLDRLPERGQAWAASYDWKPIT
ncbi:MAG: glycosyltransferase family 4 protein, partial [Bacteroidota bacterium]